MEHSPGHLDRRPEPNGADGLSYLDHLSTRVPFDAAALVAVMPNGRLQILRASLPEADAVRRYNRDLHAADVDSWSVLTSARPLVQTGGTLARLLDPRNEGQSIVLPAGSPLLPGYPGVLHLHRRSQERPFSDADATLPDEASIKSSTSASRVFVLAADLTPLVAASAFDVLEPTLRTSILAYARQRLADLSPEETLVERRAHAGVGASSHTVRYVFSSHSAAHPGGAGVVLCVQPGVDEWAALRSGDVASHAELARFLAAFHYMREHAGESLTLNDVADSVGLSPFHFHRRFVDLTGMTPKQFLLDSQIADAQRMLLEGRLDLVTIARHCGFSHQSHFTSRFKQATGFTPTRWRKTATGDGA